MTEAAVLLGGELVGSITRSGSVLRFRYAQSHLAQHQPVPLSLSMPLNRVIQSQRATIAWIQGLLPASFGVRQRLGSVLGVKAHDPLALLLGLGMDLPGAVQVVRDASSIPSHPGAYEPMTDDDFASRVRALRRDEYGWLIPDERWSLGGAQGKFTVFINDAGEMFEPKGAAPSTHIVKLGTNRARLSALNEHVCLETYRALGLPAARSRVVDVDGEPVIIVERFDRQMHEDGSVSRRHQEDLCQALANQVAYTANGGPRPDEIISLLNPQPASRDRFVRQLLANLLVGSPDGHARNYSLFLTGGGFALTPAYDVASSLPYDPIPRSGDPMHLRSVAMPIGGERQFHRIGEAQWRRFFVHNQLDTSLWMSELRDLADRLPGAVETILDKQGRNDLRDRLLSGVTAHCAAVVQRSTR